MPAVSPPFLRACIALLAGTVAYAMALLWLPASLVDGHYVPVGVDSFYHARRILDAVADPSAFYQFDPRIHAPEGSWITWPWAYDWLLAKIVRALQWVSGAQDPMAILVYIPPTWVFVNSALLTALGASLGLRLPWLALLGAAFAFSPLTQMLHGVGVIDHHYVEYSFVLATALAGLRWLQDPAQAWRGAVLGAVLGAAPAFHNGLFSLQIPVDAALLLLWWRGELPPARSVLAFAGTLAAVTLAALLPSEPFLDGQFSMTTLSWFHLYVALASGCGALLLATRPRSPANLALLAGTAALLLAPGVSEVLVGSRFLTANLVMLADMGEALSLPRQLQLLGPRIVAENYSAWIALLPLVIAACVAGLLRRDLAPHWRYAAVFGLFGTALMCFQARLHYFGSAALMVAPLLALQWLSRSSRVPRAGALAGAGVLVLAAGYQPAFGGLFEPVPPAWEFDGQYETYARLVFPPLKAACAEHPGIVLADNNDGHYLRFHTECSVISDNFILTSQHERKLLETRHALGLSVRELLEQYPYVDYIYLHQPMPDEGLAAELLYAEGPYPAALHLLTQVFLRTPQGTVVLARIFRVDHPGRAPASPPAVPPESS